MVIQRQGDIFVARQNDLSGKIYAEGTTFAEAIKNMVSKIRLLNMNEDEFQAFFITLPERTKLLVKGGMVDWTKVLVQFLK